MTTRTFLSVLLAGALTACSGGGGKSDDTATTGAPCPDGSERTTFYADDDGDGFGTPDDTVRECTRPTGYSAQGNDCDDTNPAINPNAAEICEPFDIDEDCDGKASNADADGAVGAIDTWPDNDMDGFGDPNAPVVPFCTVPPGASLEPSDCDDTDASAFPGAAFNDDPSACMQDGDGDGYGNDNPTSGAVVAGTDCNDGAAGTYLDAPEILVDGVDQDCDGADDFGLFDDFELGFPDPLTWAPAYGDIAVTYDQAFDGTQSLVLSGGGGTIETVTANTTFCNDLTWWFQGKRGPEQPDANEFLYVEYYDGSSWVQVDAWEGGAGDGAFVFRSAPITDLAAKHPDFKLRLNRIGGSTGSDDFYVDDFFVGCPGPDNDGDGVSERFDCNDFDAAHWDDCGLCVDNDNDDYGTNCNFGPDCDDADSATYPGAPDPVGDGNDTNCDGVDGSRLFDDFEAGAPSATTWTGVTGNVAVQTTYIANGTYAAEFSGAEGILESTTLDTSACSGISWSYLGLRGGPNEPEASDGLNLEYWDGTDWVLVDRWTGPGSDAAFLPRNGQFPNDPNAFDSGFKVRLISNGTSGAFDYFFVDDFAVQCADDTDGDGVVDSIDCDPTDALHWSDCGLCVDSDVDGFGTGCDLGPDCDDTDPNVSPLGTEIPTNGVDENCDGWDRDALADDFELGAPRADVWGTTTGLTVQDVDAFSGTYAADLSADGGTAETLAFDASTCTDVWFSVAVKRVGSPAVGDDLVISFDDGTQWVEFDRVAGNGSSDAGFTVFEGTLGDPAALISTLRVQLAATAGGSGTFVLDDVLLTCGGDNDGDGFPFFDDCNDADDLHWADCGICVDLDGDGYGQQCDLGFDCDDADAARNPGEPDPVGDGIDSNCDGSDVAGLFDDFELGTPAVGTWLTVSGDAQVQTTYVANGTYALNMGGGGGTAVTQNVDLSSCSAIEWKWLGKRGPDNPEAGDSITVEYQTPAGWVAGGLWDGGATDPDFDIVSGVITDPDALWASFALRLTSNGVTNSDDFFFDDFTVNCYVDGDGDGIPFADDCDDADALHWADCGLCVDGDGDGFGTDCDLGIDCDDTDSTVNAGAPDALGDGIDNNCDGTDGVELFDDFELGSVNPDTFVSLTGDGDVQTSYFAYGAYALRMGGGIATATSRTVNTSACDVIAWEYQGKRGPESPDATDFLNLEYWDGTGWVIADTWNGNGSDDPGFAPRSGLITDPLALGPDFTVRLFSDGSSTGTDEYYVDDFAVFCAEDADQDGILAIDDCDDTDPAHWFDCGLCVDADGDDFGLDCDLGPDCDDADATTNPLAPDPVGDGLDTNCDGVDGVLLRDDFETGALNPLTMASLSGQEFDIQTTYVASGTYALHLGGVSTLETLTTDTSACPELVWGYKGKRGPGAPDATDFLYVEWWSGTTWVQQDAWEGTGSDDAGFSLRWGVITNPAAFHPGFKARFVADSSSTVDDYYLDDVAVGCASSADGDGDGTPDLFDCDPIDPAHWNDCGLCVDADGDDYGLDCDLGPDCDDADPNVNPTGVDLGMNGADEDCNGIDGPPLLFDDLELGVPDPLVWSSVVGDAGADNTQFASGSWSLNLGGAVGTATTVVFDSTPCVGGLAMAFKGKQGPDNPEATDVVDFYYWDGTGMVLFDSWFGGNPTAKFLDYAFVTTDVLALRVDAQLELISSGTGANFDDFFLDDIAIGCAP